MAVASCLSNRTTVRICLTHAHPVKEYKWNECILPYELSNNKIFIIYNETWTVSMRYLAHRISNHALVVRRKQSSLQKDYGVILEFKRTKRLSDLSHWRTIIVIYRKKTTPSLLWFYGALPRKWEGVWAFPSTRKNMQQQWLTVVWQSDVPWWILTSVMRHVRADGTKRRPTNKIKAKDIGRNGKLPLWEQFVLINCSSRLKAKV